METGSAYNKTTNAACPEELVSMLEAWSGSIEASAPRRLRTDEARSVVDTIVKTNVLGKEHLEQIINYAQKSSEYCWDQEEHTGLHAIEFRRLARLYDSIAETAERKLKNLRQAQ